MPDSSAAGKAFWVQATKKGGVPISVSKVKWGKHITLLENVHGDGAALLTSLKNALGTGGLWLSTPGIGSLEVQGDQREALEAWLVRQGLVVGLAKAKPAAADTKGAATDRCEGDGEEDSAAKGRAACSSAKGRWAPGLSTAVQAAAAAGAPAGPRDAPDGLERFARLMRSWPFWDHDYARLGELFEHRGGQDWLRAGEPVDEVRTGSQLPTRPKELAEALRGLGEAPKDSSRTEDSSGPLSAPCVTPPHFAPARCAHRTRPFHNCRHAR